MHHLIKPEDEAWSCNPDNASEVLKLAAESNIPLLDLVCQMYGYFKENKNRRSLREFVTSVKTMEGGENLIQSMCIHLGVAMLGPVRS